MRPRHIHITGASGAGVSTTGQLLAARLAIDVFDTDNFFWLPTNPPYRDKRAITERLKLLGSKLSGCDGWVLSGALDGWGDLLIPHFDLVVFLYVPSLIRLERLKRRERARFGAALDPGGAMFDQHQAFLEWAASYDSGTHDGGRTLSRHQDWLTQLPCPVLRIEGDVESEEIVDRIMAHISGT